MGSREDEENPRRRSSVAQNNNNKYKLKILVLVILTNLLTVYIFRGPHPFSESTHSDELNSTKAQLIHSYSLIAELLQKINSTNSLVESLRVELSSSRGQQVDSFEKVSELLAAIKSSASGTNERDEDDGYFGIARSSSDELKLAVLPQKFPLGYSPKTGSEEIYPPVGAGCLRFQQELAQYMNYEVGGECPVDDVFAQKFLLRGCEPLPRRRCKPKSPVGYVEPRPFPECLWATPPDTSIIWDPYSCKSYQCLIERRKRPGIYDCKDCFHLQGREKVRWLSDGGINYGIDQVLQTKPPGTIRIGFDIGGGAGTFAARMRERNITIITTSMNLDGPFNSFIASRGLIPMHLTVSQRLPFFENTLDIVHSMHVLSNWIPDAMLEFIFYDIYRVLRPGGLFWLDHFFCRGNQVNQTYIPMFDRIGFNKLRWNLGKKVDRGADEWYLSALFEKPMT